MEKKLVSVSGIDPIYNDKGKIVGWELAVSYEIKMSMLWRTIRTAYYRRRDDLFDLGYNALRQQEIKFIAQLDAQRIAERTAQTR